MASAAWDRFSLKTKGMKNNNQQTQDNKNRLLWRYTGLAFQFIVGIAIFLFAGIKLDDWMRFQTPLATCLLPLLFITSVIIKAVIDTGKK